MTKSPNRKPHERIPFMEMRGLATRPALKGFDFSIREAFHSMFPGSRKGKLVLSREGRFARIQAQELELMRLVRTYKEVPRDPPYQRIIQSHQKRVLRILDGKEKPTAIFEGMIPIIENARRIALVRAGTAERILAHIHAKTPLPDSMKKNEGVYSQLARDQKRYTKQAADLEKVHTRFSEWAGAVEQGKDLSSLAQKLIRAIEDDLQGHGIMD